MILDYHFSQFNPDTLKNANAAAIVDTMVRLKVLSDHPKPAIHDHLKTGHMETDSGTLTAA